MTTVRPDSSPFIARKEELGKLHQCLNLALKGACQFVVISGELGVGKDRLAGEVGDLARARDIKVLRGRLAEQDGTFPYLGFCELVQDYFRQKETTTSDIVDLSDLASDLIALFPMLSEIEPIRTAASGSSTTIQEQKAHTPENRTQVFELLARTIIRMSGGRPLLLFFDSLHAADASLEALQYIVRRLGPTPTLIIGTCLSTEIGRRPPAQPDGGRIRGRSSFSLD